MKFAMKIVAAFALACMAIGCCIESRSWKIDKEVPRGTPLRTGLYCSFTNGEMVATRSWRSYDGKTGTYYSPKTIDKFCCYANGPWANSDIYPATRHTLNALSGWSYSSAASGNYMLNIVTLPCYPLVLVNLPIQFVLDTVLMPYDLIAAPTAPEGYRRRGR